MFNARGRPYVAAAIFTVVALSACSDEPTSADVEQALEKRIVEVAEMANQWGLSEMADSNEVHSVEVLECVAIEDSEGYRCDVNLDVSSALGRHQGVESMRLLKGSHGWVVLE